MNAKVFRPVILKTLKDANTNKPASLEVLVDRIIDNMSLFEEMLSLAGGETAVLQSAPPPEDPAPIIFDMTKRIVPKQERTYSEEEIQELKNEAIVKYKAALPLSVRVQPPGFDKPIEVIFRGPMNSRGAMPFIGLQWAAVGASRGFDVQQDVTGTLMTVEQVLENVREQAAALYFSTPRAIQPRIPAPRDTNLSTGSWDVMETDRINGN